METNKQIIINILDGYIIDEEKSVLKESNIVFKKKEIELPKTWNEAIHMRLFNKTIFSDRIIPDDLKVYGSLRKLEILRDIYRQGWKPDWTINDSKYVINYVESEIHITSYNYSSEFLSFQSAEIRDEFLRNFKDLIEECKEFI